jgi:hypothetical protein
MVGSRHREVVSLVHAFCGGAELKLLSKYTAYPSRNSNFHRKHILAYKERIRGKENTCRRWMDTKRHTSMKKMIGKIREERETRFLYEVCEWRERSEKSISSTSSPLSSPP